MSVLVVTGTGTGVGKTVVTAALAAVTRARGGSVAVVKPAQTGIGPDEPGDCDDVRRLAGIDAVHELARFPDPLAPAAAARVARRPPVDLRMAADVVRGLSDGHDLVLVEGAGGLLVHFDAAGTTLADLAGWLGASVLLVTRPDLGTLNHTSLTLEALARRGLGVEGVVIGAWPTAPDLACRCNVADLEDLAGRPLAGALPEALGSASRDRFLAAALAGLDPALGGTFDAAAFRSAHEATATTPLPRRPVPEGPHVTDILEIARQQVLDDGVGLGEAQVLQVLALPDDRLTDLLELAHEVRMRWCGPEVEVEGIVSVKTGGCPEDCHFCSQSGQFTSPVRAAWLDIPALVRAAEETAATGASEFCIVAAVRGPDTRLMRQVRDGVAAIREAVEINVACSLGMLTQAQVDELAEMGVHRYNHNLETARSYFPKVVTTHTWQERWDTLTMVREAGMEVCCGGIVGMGETLAQRAEFASQLGDLGPDEVPMNFLNPRPGTPFGDLTVMAAREALRTIAAFRLALPRTILRFAGGREITLGDLGTERGLLGGINAVIVGNYLTTLGRPAADDLALLGELSMPVKALGATL